MDGMCLHIYSKISEASSLKFPLACALQMDSSQQFLASAFSSKERETQRLQPCWTPMSVSIPACSYKAERSASPPSQKKNALSWGRWMCISCGMAGNNQRRKQLLGQSLSPVETSSCRRHGVGTELGRQEGGRRCRAAARGISPRQTGGRVLLPNPPQLLTLQAARTRD